MSIGLVPNRHVHNPLYDAPTTRRTKAVLVILVLLVVSAGPLFYWWKTFGGGTGDPGGRILAQLRSVQAGVPKGASINYAHFVEPLRQDSCDGMPGTQGWDDVIVDISFKWSGSPIFLVSYAREILQKVGWGAFHPQTSYGAPGGQWTMRLANGTMAIAQLGYQVSGSWTLFTEAPPVGKSTSGC